MARASAQFWVPIKNGIQIHGWRAWRTSESSPIFWMDELELDRKVPRQQPRLSEREFDWAIDDKITFLFRNQLLSRVGYLVVRQTSALKLFMAGRVTQRHLQEGREQDTLIVTSHVTFSRINLAIIISPEKIEGFYDQRHQFFSALTTETNV